MALPRRLAWSLLFLGVLAACAAAPVPKKESPARRDLARDNRFVDLMRLSMMDNPSDTEEMILNHVRDQLNAVKTELASRVSEPETRKHVAELAKDIADVGEEFDSLKKLANKLLSLEGDKRADGKATAPKKAPVSLGKVVQSKPAAAETIKMPVLNITVRTAVGKADSKADLEPCLDTNESTFKRPAPVAVRALEPSEDTDGDSPDYETAARESLPDTAVKIVNKDKFEGEDKRQHVNFPTEPTIREKNGRKDGAKEGTAGPTEGMIAM